MQAPAVCQLYGTVAGCRRGKRCQNLHVQDDGGLAKTKASPMTEHGYADSFRNRMLTLMREFLRQQGSTTEVLGASFRDGAKTVRFTVRTTEQPSHCSYMVAAGSLQYRDGAVGNGSFHIQPAMIRNDAVFFPWDRCALRHVDLVDRQGDSFGAVQSDRILHDVGVPFRGVLPRLRR